MVELAEPFLIIRFGVNMAAPRKRQLEEIEALDELDRPIPNANIHGAVTMLSPVKKGRNSLFFDGTIADGKSSVRLVGFSAEQQKKLTTLQQNKKPINIVNCEIKSSRQGHKMEVMLKNATVIQESTKEIDSAAFEQEEVETVNAAINELGKIQNYQKINVQVKVLSNSEAMYVIGGGGGKKQDVIIADTKLTLWEQYVHSLDEGPTEFCCT